MTLAALASVLVNCTYLRESIGLGYTKPVVTLHGLELKSVSFDNIDIYASIEIANPNRFSLKCQNIRYEMFLVDQKIASGEHSDTVTVEGGKKELVKMPISFQTKGMVSLFQKIMSKDKNAKVFFMARTEFDTPIGLQEIVFKDEYPLSNLAK